MKASKSSVPTDPAPRKVLRLHDAVSIIVGIVVGTAIFKAPTLVAQNCHSGWQAMALWTVGGVLSLLGAFCYAELTTSYPQSGGDYAYFNRAYGRWLGFIFGWGQLTVVLTASIASMAYVFADYSANLWQLSDSGKVWVAITAVVLLSFVNALGMVFGKTAQNVLTIAKVIGILLIVAAGITATETTVAAPVNLTGTGSLGMAMVFVLYAYGGWNDTAFVAAEVQDGERNLPRALLYGIAGITAIYLVINWVLLAVLGFAALRETFTPAADVLRLAFGSLGAKMISTIIMVSSLGAMNGTMLTGSRVYAELGKDYHVLRWLGGWNSKRRAPTSALAAQAVVTVLMILAVGTEVGRSVIDQSLQLVFLPAIPWDQYFGGFDTLVAASAPVFWTFFLLTGIAIFVLRAKEPNITRPFRIPFFPLPAFAFCGMCLYMLYSSVAYAKTLALFACVPLALGFPLFLLEMYWQKQSK